MDFKINAQGWRAVHCFSYSGLLHSVPLPFPMQSSQFLARCNESICNFQCPLFRGVNEEVQQQKTPPNCCLYIYIFSRY